MLSARANECAGLVIEDDKLLQFECSKGTVNTSVQAALADKLDPILGT